jgi:hypothetical protein
MAHYAFLDDNNTVTEVIVGVDETELLEGLSTEEWYGKFRQQRCIRTSYNGRIRGRYAGIGYFYDEVKDEFISPYPEVIYEYEESVHPDSGSIPISMGSE